MIDLKLLRASPDQVRAALGRRGDASITRLLDELEALDIRRRALTGQLDQLKAERNAASQVDARLMKEKGELPADVRAQRKQLGERIAGLDVALRELESELERTALFVPNLPLPELPDGDAGHNQIVRAWGEPATAGGPRTGRSPSRSGSSIWRGAPSWPARGSRYSSGPARGWCAP